MPALHLFDEEGRRLFINFEERAAFFKAANRAADTTRTFSHLLHYTGCNISEAITLTPKQIDIRGRTVLLQSATERRHDISRAVPIPDAFIALLREVHNIHTRSDERAEDPLWPHHAHTMRDKLSRVIREAGIAGGPHAMPKGIRYGFLVHAIRCGVILTRAEKWMGNARSSELGHYVEQLARFAPDVVGDERDDAALMW
jgi:integrase/recombinase XerD